jgi:hypothetical protein
MKKLALDLDTLDVQSFATQSAAKPGAGTVHAHSHLVSCFYCGMSWPYTGCTDCSCFEICNTPACE